MKIGEEVEHKIKGWESVEFEKPCVSLKFLFKHNKSNLIPNYDTDFMTPRYGRWLEILPTEERHSGEYEITVYAKDYIINERVIDTFTVTVLGFKTLTIKDENFKLEEDEKELSVAIKQITPEGQVTLEFSKRMQELEDLDVL